MASDQECITALHKMARFYDVNEDSFRSQAFLSVNPPIVPKKTLAKMKHSGYINYEEAADGRTNEIDLNRSAIDLISQSIS